MKKRFVPVLALAIGSLPGFLLPVALLWTVSPDEADVLLLAISISQFSGSLVASTLEAHLVAIFGTSMARGDGVALRGMRALTIWGLVASGAVMLTATPVIALIYSAGSSHVTWVDLIVGCWPLLLVPLVATQAAKWSALLLAYRNLSTTYIGNVFRGGFTLIVAFLWPAPWALALSYLLGEIVRWVFFRWRSASLASTGAFGSSLVPTAGSMAHQISSMAISQTGPVAIRAFLAASAPGAVAIAEVATRILIAANQVAASSLNMHAVLHLPEALSRREGRLHRQVMRREAMKLVLLNLALAAAVIVAVSIAALVLSRVIPEDVLRGMLLALPLLISAPFVSLNFWASRSLLLAGTVWPLTPIAVASALACLVSGWLLFSTIGGSAIVLGSGFGYLAGAVLSLLAVWTVGLRKIERDFD